MSREWRNERRKRSSGAMQRCGALIFVTRLNAPAFADCNIYGGGAVGSATVSLPGNLSIVRDSAVGSILFDSTWVATNVVRPNCGGTGPVISGYVAAMVPVPGFANVYETGVAGIGIKTSWLATVVNVNTYTIDSARPLASPASTVAGFTAGVQGNMGYFRVQLIHTGQVLPGSFNLPTKLASGVYGTAEINVLNLSNNTASVAAPACTVQQSAVSVTMPVASGRYLPSVGSTTGDTGFSISINCPSPVSVSMTMTDAANPDNVSSTLSLSAASTAKGVGYQIVYNGTAISYGPDSAVMNNVNQFNVGKVSVSGALTIPFTARYVRTGQIVPGTADANATFTMSYQ